MKSKSKQLFSPFFLFSLFILIPLLMLGIHNSHKLLEIYFLNQTDYTITKAKLLSNHHRKYNNNTTYQFKAKGKILEGSDSSILWGYFNEEITIYFEKKHTENNGTLSGLFFFAIGQCLALILFGSYVIYKTARYARTP